MSYGVEFINVLEAAPPGRDTWDPLNAEDGAGIAVHRANARNLEKMCLSPLIPTRSRIIYFPPGRYIIGRLHPETEPQGEQLADLVIPADVTLMFADGAVLVPAGYDPVTNPELSRNPGGAFPRSERYKVRIEIQGNIEAGIHQIFDVFMDTASPADPWSATSAGRILLQRDLVRAVYPEWWGAVPLVGEAPGTHWEVRRTTAALQAALDTAFNLRVGPEYHRKPIPDTALVTFNPTANRASIPIVLANDYAIDSPLVVGASMHHATEIFGPRAASFVPDRLPVNITSGVVIRGECGPATRSLGAALIKAADGFRVPTEAPPTPLSTVPAEVDSMFVMRTLSGGSIENVVFDAAEKARRCVTLQLPASSLSHHNGFVGCEFRNARQELVWIGGEPKAPTFDMETRVDITGPAGFFFSGGQDYSSLRFTRCLFDTGDPDSPDVMTTLTEFSGAARKQIALFPKQALSIGIWRIGVVFRAEQSLGTEFHGCVFRGIASPMLLAIGGRLSLQRCSFRTDSVPMIGVAVTGPVATTPTPGTVTDPDDDKRRQWNGTDVYLAAGYNEHLDGVSPLNRVPTTLTARDVDSRSRQFLTTYPAIGSLSLLSNQGAASVLLIRLRHRSSFADAATDPRPAIYWGGPRTGNNVLALDNCMFGTGLDWWGGVFVSAPSNVTGAPVAPVVDLGSSRWGGGEFLLGPRAVSLQSIMRLGAE